jgi:hypothetical protein
MTDVSRQCLDRAQACDLDCQSDTADVLREAAAEIDRLREALRSIRQHYTLDRIDAIAGAALRGR